MNRRDVIKVLGITPLLNITTVADAVSANAKVEDAQLLVYGATPGGVTCAIRAAREGVNVLLVSPFEHLGGMFANGLGIMDTLYNGSRSPLYDEFRQGIYDWYRKKYGTNSPQYANAGPGISKTKYEAHVAEQLITQWLAAEPRITIVKGFYPVAVRQAARKITHVDFVSMDGNTRISRSARVFADCSYEGDLAAIAKVPCVIGRESRDEYGEKYAGVIFSKDIRNGTSEDSLNEDEKSLIRKLNLYRYDETSTKIFKPESTGEAHPAVQAFNLRAILTDDPQNRIIPQKPANYDSAYFARNYTHKAEKLALSRPNNKTSLNYPKIVGLQNKYVEGGWKERKEVVDRYRDELLGLLYFRQNDDSLDPAIRQHWRQFGLAKDEFPDNGHLPYEIYVRESRRIKGKKVFTQHDAQLANGLKRAPVHSDSITITEWFLDSHACTDRQVGDSKKEGEIMLKSETVPGQVPLGTIFPSALDNFIVPVCLSASHIGWGAIRLEPVWMSIGEVAGYVASEAVANNRSVSAIDPEKLGRKLATHRFMLSFFNDMEGREAADWYPAIQFLGTKGFFATYEANPTQKLTEPLAAQWAGQLCNWKTTGNWNATNQAKKTLAAESAPGEPVTAKAFASKIGSSLGMDSRMQSLLNNLGINKETVISRGDAARLIFEATAVI